MKPNEDMKQLIIDSNTHVLSTIEAFIDSELTNEVAKGIPGANIAVTIIKSPFILKKYYFAKKVKRFLAEFAETTSKQRRTFVDRIKKNPKLLTDIGSITMHYIDHCDDEVKAAIVGHIYRLMIDEAISHEDGFRTCSVVLNILLQDIIKFCNSELKDINNDQLLASIAAAQGLLVPYYDVVSYEASPGMDTLESFQYLHSSFGSFFREFVGNALKKQNVS